MLLQQQQAMERACLPQPNEPQLPPTPSSPTKKEKCLVPNCDTTIRKLLDFKK
jgi:hypothetical protein